MKKRYSTGFGLPVYCIFFVILLSLFYTGSAEGQVISVSHLVPLEPSTSRIQINEEVDSLLLLPSTSCQNSDFSFGTFTNWSGCSGKWCADTLPNSTRCTGNYVPFNPPCNNPNQPWYNTPVGGHFSIQNPGQDPCINALSRVFPGDAHSALIGNRVCNNNNAGGYVDQVKYQIAYDPNNSFFIYRCAVVLANIQDPTHNTANRRPRFTFVILDHVTGDTIDPVCGFYDLWPGDGITTWNQTGAPLNFYWKDWSTIGIDFSVLPGVTTGQLLDVVFMIHGCGFQAHTGYAYISAFCGSMTIQVAGCEGSGSVTMTGPPGFTLYQWQGPYCPTCPPNPPIYPGNPVTITTGQGAVTGNVFMLTVTALNGCQVQNVQQIIAFTNVAAAFTHGSACVNHGMQFTDQSTCSQNQITNWDWNFGDATPIQHVKNPIHIYAAANTYTVTLIAYSSDGCSDTTTSQVTVDPLPTPSFTNGENSVCLNTPGQVYTTQAGKLSYIWIIPPQATVTAGGTTTDNSVTLTWNTVGSYSISVNYTEPITLCTAANPTPFAVTVNPLPTAIISGTTAVCQNSASPLITFTGASSTAPYTFTYNINGLPDQTVTTIVGNSVTVAAPTNAVGTFTYNLVSVQDGGSPACSQPQTGSAVVTVNPLPTASIAGTIAVCQNSASPLITFTGASSTAPYTFTYNINGLPDQTVTTTVGNSVTVAAPTNIVGTFTYNLVSVQDGSPTTCSQAQSGSADVTVNTLPTATIAGTITVCQNSASPLITFTGASTTAPYTFTYNINGLPNQTVTTTVGNSVTVAAPTNAAGTFTYNLVSVQDGSPTSCFQVQTGSAVVTVNPLPTATISGTITVCQNSASPLITFTGASSTAPYTFTYNINGLPNQTVTTIVGNSVTVAAPTNILGIFSYNLVSVQDGSSTLCSQAQAGSAVVTVSTLPSPTISGLNTICSGDSTSYITQIGMNNYLWQVSTGGTIIAGGGTSNNTVTVMWNTAGIQTVSVNYSMAGCTASQPFVYNVTVKPRPSVTNADNSTTCSNVPISIALFASLPGTTFTWTATGSSGSVSGFSASGGQVISQILINSGFNIETVDYAVTPSLNGCDGPVANYIVTVDPVADAYFNPNGQTFCSGGTSSISILSHVAGATFTWNGVGSSGNISGFGPGVTSSITQTLTNIGTGPETVTYTISPSLNSCPGTPNSVVVTVNPLPSVSYTICNDLITTTAAQPIKLRGGLPLGGTYTGTGVNTGIFYPSIAGIGNHTITYSYPNTWGCAANATQMISVVNPAVFLCDNPMTDIRDNKQYPTVKLGTQCWMSANLNYGTFIVSTQMQRDNCVFEKYCFTDILANCTSYGGLYQWDELMQYDNAAAAQGFCPPGWHVPTENEWTTLFGFYISNGFAGSPLKSTGYSGFNAFLSGTRFNNVNFYFNNFAVMFWSSTTHGADKAWAHGMNTFNPSVSYYPSSRTHAFNLRCIKD